MMNLLERRAIFSLASIFALRMLGLFMIFPVFALYIGQLSGATPLLIGLAMGVYGFTQAVLQIPFGIWSDRSGRKRVIAIGLLVFIAGSVMTALAHSAVGAVLGRALQGAGAVGSASMALVADLTRPQQRSQAMAVIGMTIGISFVSAMVLGPFFSRWISVTGLLWLTAGFGGLALMVLYRYVPAPVQQPTQENSIVALKSALLRSELLRLNGGVFILHAIFTASFIAIPIVLHDKQGIASTAQWEIYLPSLLLAALSSLPLLAFSEKRKKMSTLFLISIIVLGISEFAFLLSDRLQGTFAVFRLALLCFFIAFTLLEASLPSFIARAADVSQRGTAMGVYSCCQFFGIFIGGILGGWLYGHYGVFSIFIACVIGAGLWLGFASNHFVFIQLKR